MTENHLFLRYLEDVQLKNQFFDELDHLKERWECLKEREHKQIYYKKETTGGIISVFFRVKLNTHMINPYSLLQEIHLMKNWVPDIVRSDIIHKLSEWRKVVYVNRKMPFFIDTREAIVCATSYLVPERKGAMVMIRSMDDQRKQSWNITDDIIPKPNVTVVRMNIRGFMYIEYIDENTCWYHGNMNVNPNFAYMPDWFLNFVLKKVVDVIVIKLRKENVFDNPDVKQKMVERKEFYESLTEHLKEAGVQFS